MSTAKSKFRKDDVEFVYNLLRHNSVIWSGRAEVLFRARRKFVERRTKAGKVVYKFYWKCAVCKEWFRNSDDMEVDHIVEIGGVGGYKGDMHEFVFSIIPRPVKDHLQCLCKWCHLKKTKKYNSAKTKWERKIK